MTDPKRKSLSAMDMVAVLTKVVQAKDAEIQVLKKKMAKIEAILTNLALDASTKMSKKVTVNTK